ncbi:MAG: uracil-DNA glycosylase [Actinomycetota bacterium]|nr:uracil-DNA glycosylase [Actinomycetota bacterium]MDA3013767.1 uracil-DNA glycosylase [Actinomycetota bacterium]
MNKILDFEKLKKVCLDCKQCNLSKTRTNVVFGRGNPNTKIFVIGEGPGHNEDIEGLAFVGRAGKLLDAAFQSVGIDTNKDCYISNIVKCRPPNNRKPLNEEIQSCSSWLNQQINLINPRIIVLAGSTAVESYLHIKEPISKIRGKWIERDGRKFMPIFHPSYLLRNPSKEKGKPKWLTWKDLKLVKTELEALKK